MLRKLYLTFIFCLVFAVSLSAQEPAEDQSAVEPMAKVPTYRVTVIERTTKAVNYRHRGGATKVSFQGTDLMPSARGGAQVEGKAGRLEIDANFENLKPARELGSEYLTYVLWAITPEGRPANLGEIQLDGNKSNLRATTELQAFGLIVTAEPYFAVTRPSNLVVMENVVRPETLGGEHPIDAKFDLLERGEYTIDVPAEKLPATGADAKVPLNLLEARNAVAIARAAGAEQYAADSLKKAEDFLAKAEDYYQRKQGKTPIGTVARAAVQTAEDARVLTIRQREQEKLTADQRAIEEREAQARAEAQAASEREAQARSEAEMEAQHRQQAEADRLAAEQAKADAEMQKQQLEQQAAEEREQTQAEIETAKAEAERKRLEAEQAAQLAAQERQRAEAAQAEAQAQQQHLQAETERARQAAQQAHQARLRAEQQQEQMRERLTQQLNQVLATKETARGVVANMPEVLFDTGKSTLKPGARERLAKVAGIVLAYPDLKLEIEGHTDAVGNETYNQRLSERRAANVRDYLINQGVGLNNVVARGFGEVRPIAPNTKSSGRKVNRRVELVVTGAAIGRQAGVSSRVTPPPSPAQPRR
jgi:outer membrane protein OmpA-like peptidoglycan-associated protein